MTVAINPRELGPDGRPLAMGGWRGILYALAQGKDNWSPALVGGVLVRGWLALPGLPAVLRLLLNPIYRKHLKQDPRFLLKFTTHDFLARCFTPVERARCFAHHYNRMSKQLPADLLQKILAGEVALLELIEGGQRFLVSLGLSKPHDKEGEFSLSLMVADEPIYVLSFDLVPGDLVGSKASDVLLVTRVQGVRGSYKQIAQVTKALHDVAPAALLLSVLQGMGRAIGLQALGSIQGKHQTAYNPEYASSFLASYDSLFTDLGAELNNEGFYLLPIPMPEKPMTQIKQGHKLRTRAKREFKRQITEAVQELFVAMRCGRSVDNPVRIAGLSAELVRVASEAFGD